MPHDSTSHTLQRPAYAVCAAVLAIAVYANALHNPFVYDDYHTVTANRSIAPPLALQSVLLYDAKRPLVNVSYAVDRALWGPRPLGFHATSVALHAVNVVLLFAVAATLISGPTGLLAAASSAALFAVHPITTEAVGYVSARSELLSACFVLASFLCGVRWIRRGGARWASGMVALWAAGLLSKETAIILPLLVALWDVLGRYDPAETRRRVRALYAPLGLAAVLIGIARLALLMRVEQRGSVSVHSSFALLALDVIVRYARLTVFPQHQTLFHAVAPVDGIADPRVLRAIAICAAAVLLAWRVRRRAPAATFGMALFVLALAPSALLTTLNVGEPMAEHRAYLAAMGLAIAAGSGVSAAIAWSRPRVRGATVWVGTAVAIVVAAFALQTTVRNVVWSSPVALWQESVDLAPTHPRPRLLLGEALEDSGRRRDALVEYEAAVRLDPSDPNGRVKLGLCLAGLARFDEARAQLSEALRLDPDNAPARRALAVLAQVRPAT